MENPTEEVACCSKTLSDPPKLQPQEAAVSQSPTKSVEQNDEDVFKCDELDSLLQDAPEYATDEIGPALQTEPHEFSDDLSGCSGEGRSPDRTKPDESECFFAELGADFRLRDLSAVVIERATRAVTNAKSVITCRQRRRKLKPASAGSKKRKLGSKTTGQQQNGVKIKHRRRISASDDLSLTNEETTIDTTADTSSMDVDLELDSSDLDEASGSGSSDEVDDAVNMDEILQSPIDDEELQHYANLAQRVIYPLAPDVKTVGNLCEFVEKLCTECVDNVQVVAVQRRELETLMRRQRDMYGRLAGLAGSCVQQQQQPAGNESGRGVV